MVPTSLGVGLDHAVLCQAYKHFHQLPHCHVTRTSEWFWLINVKGGGAAWYFCFKHMHRLLCRPILSLIELIIFITFKLAKLSNAVNLRSRLHDYHSMCLLNALTAL